MRVESVEDFKKLANAIAYLIREAKEIPSGHLYAQLMDKVDIDMCRNIIDMLKKAKLIDESNFLLIWIGK